MARVDGKVVRTGDIVGFKSDTEQDGRITQINGDLLTLEALSDEGFRGDYIGGRMVTTQSARDCWLEE